MLTKYAEDKNIQSIYFKSHNFTLKEALMPNGLMPVIVERASQLSLECFNNDRFMGVENVIDKQGFVGFRTVPLSHFFEPAITTLTLTTIIDEAINLSKKHSVIASNNELDLSYLPNIHKKVPQTLNISIKQGGA